MPQTVTVETGFHEKGTGFKKETVLTSLVDLWLQID